MTLIKFQPIQISKIPLPTPKSNEETAEAISQTIIDLTRIAQPIHIAYLLEPTTNNTGGGVIDPTWIGGTATKRKSGTWSLTLENGDECSMTSEEILKSPNVAVENAYTELGASGRKRTNAKKKRIRTTETRAKERKYIALAQEKQKEDETMNATKC
jgi:hypothetical protein